MPFTVSSKLVEAFNISFTSSFAEPEIFSLANACEKPTIAFSGVLIS